jgi:hypothetical protein
MEKTMEEMFDLNLNKITPELNLILSILRCDSEYSVYEKLSIKSNIDWDLFLKLTIHHRLYPVIAGKLKDLNEQIIPKYVNASLSKAYKNNTFRMLHMMGETEYVSELFNVNEVPTIFLKGPSLAADLYGNISFRTSSDIDILIPINLLEKAEAILIEDGYIKDDYIETILNDWKWRHHHLSFFHPEKQVKLEVHWRLHPGPSYEPSFMEMWNRKRQCQLSSKQVYLLGKEDLFVFLVTHGARHGWSRLRWLVDIHQLIEKDLDWEKVIFLFTKYQAVPVGGHAIILSNALLKTTLAKEMKILTNHKKSILLAQEALFYLKDMINLHEERLPDEVAKYHRHYLFSLMSKSQKFLFILSFFHPYPEDAEMLPLPKKLHYLYFPLRPILWVLRKTRKHAVV